MTTAELAEGVVLLRRTPQVLRVLLSGLPDAWLAAREGPDTWSPYDVVGHLVHGERTDWLPRARQILEGRGDEPFPPFDRFAQFRESRGRTLDELLDEFARLRAAGLAELEGLSLTDADLACTGTHPEFGRVTLGQLLSTWVCHDLSHLAQVARVLARIQGEAVGPWAAYLSVLRR